MSQRRFFRASGNDDPWKETEATFPALILRPRLGDKDRWRLRRVQVRDLSLVLHVSFSLCPRLRLYGFKRQDPPTPRLESLRLALKDGLQHFSPCQQTLKVN